VFLGGLPSYLIHPVGANQLNPHSRLFGVSALTRGLTFNCKHPAIPSIHPAQIFPWIKNNNKTANPKKKLSPHLFQSCWVLRSSAVRRSYGEGMDGKTQWDSERARNRLHTTKLAAPPRPSSCQSLTPRVQINKRGHSWSTLLLLPHNSMTFTISD
jgi:hypothetical protein